MNETSKPHRLRWFQFSLRSLILVMLLACIGMSWVGVKMQKARRQKEAVEEIKKLGGEVRYYYHGKIINWAQPSNPMWLRTVFGDDCFANVDHVGLGNTNVTDEGVEHLKGLNQLETLWLNNTQVTDAGLERLKGLAQLQWLSLNSTKVTDEGVKKLRQALPNCQIAR